MILEILYRRIIKYSEIKLRFRKQGDQNDRDTVLEYHIAA